MIYISHFTIESRGNWDSLNITENVRKVVKNSGVVVGVVNVFYQHTTGGVVIIEHEAGFLVDMENVIERLIPSNDEYAHHLREYDKNGGSHLQTLIISPFVVIPIINGDLALGEYQDILVVDMQPELKKRDIIIQVLG